MAEVPFDGPAYPFLDMETLTGDDRISIFCSNAQSMPRHPVESKYHCPYGLVGDSSPGENQDLRGCMMKAKLMALALLFAFIGFINSHAGTVADGRAVVEGLKEGPFQYWLSTSWHPSPEVQGLLFLFQAAVGGAMVVYFLRSQKKSSDLDWTHSE